MFRLSNGETYSRLEIYCFDDLLGYITKNQQGYHFTLVKSETIHHKFTLLNLSEQSTSEEIRKWMKEQLTIPNNRFNRETCYPSWCCTLEDEISVYSYFLDAPMITWFFTSRQNVHEKFDVAKKKERNYKSEYRVQLC